MLTVGGVWTSQNQVRPGAYMRFVSRRQANLATGSRGVVLLPMELSWGMSDELIPITPQDFVGGKTGKQIGLLAGDPRIQVLREVLKNANLCYVYKLNSDAVAAKVSLPMAGVQAEAIYGGTYGNQLIVTSIQVGTSNVYFVVTTLQGEEVDRQQISTVGEFVPNAWIKLTGTGSIPLEEFAGQALVGGTDGAAITDTSYLPFFDLAMRALWNTMAIPSDSVTLPATVLLMIKEMRDKEGKKVQAVVRNFPTANYEGIISVDQGYKIGEEEVSVASFVGFVAGLTAAAEVNQSNTYAPIVGATGIINPRTSLEIEAGLKSGKFLISQRQDLVIVVEKDINTLYDFPSDRSYAFSKNRVIRCLDDIAMQISLLFEKSYIGKVDNTDYGRTLYRGDVIGYLLTLQNLGSIQNFDPVVDLEVLPGNDIESVVCNLAVQTVDSMEKLYMSVVVS